MYIKIKHTSFINPLKGITLRIAWLNAIYSTSMVLKSIYVCNSLHPDSGPPTYIITYPVCNMKVYTFSAYS